MIATRLTIICGGFGLLVGCAREPPPRSVAEFLENRILLEATMIRCGENRNMSKYEADCVNAREAINRIAAEEQRARRAELEAQSERKRKALRRTQQAAAEARRRAAEERRRREEAEYLGVFEDLPPGEQGGTDGETESVQPDAGAIEPPVEDTSQAEDQLDQDID
ncbi:MAG: EexN family lipoprotein [Woeseia sp.]